MGFRTDGTQGPRHLVGCHAWLGMAQRLSPRGSEDLEEGLPLAVASTRTSPLWPPSGVVLPRLSWGTTRGAMGRAMPGNLGGYGNAATFHPHLALLQQEPCRHLVCPGSAIPNRPESSRRCYKQTGSIEPFFKSRPCFQAPLAATRTKKTMCTAWQAPNQKTPARKR